MIGQTVVVNSPSCGLTDREGEITKLIREETPGSPNLWEVVIDGQPHDVWENEMEPAPMATWRIRYISCESNERWYTKEVPASWTEERVRGTIIVGGCGDDVAEIISVEREG